jgi:hypothetical protein
MLLKQKDWSDKMSDTRAPREIKTREFEERPKQWMPPDLLPEPDKQPGFDYRWIRVAMNAVADPRNISSRLREGYEPVDVSEQPKMKLLAHRDGPYKGNIEIGGLLLCKIPTEFVGQMQEYYAKQTRLQSEAVDNNLMRQSDPRMPIFNERRSSVSFGKGS